MKTVKFFLFICLFPIIVWGKDISSNEIDIIVQDAMNAFSVPGIAVGVIQDGKVIHSKGYGINSILNGGDVDKNTYFGIASNSKGFTATALAILVDEGKISWDDRVQKYLPDFHLWDNYVSENFTIRDLLSHHSGLPLGSGDLMWWPDANYSPDEVIKKMRYLKPDRDFRTTYAYNNLPFIVAGAIIPAVTGKPYHTFLQERIFDPLNMKRCTANTPIMAGDDNIAEPHAVLDSELKQVKRYLVLDQVVGSVAAAGIQCSVDDLLKWETMHLNHGRGLMKEETHDTLWQINTPMPVSQTLIDNGTNFRGYSLGYNINDYHGKRVVSHGGALIGMYSHLSMIPEMNFAIAIATNQQSGAAYTAIKNKLINLAMDIEQTIDINTIANLNNQSKFDEAIRLANLKGNGIPPLELNTYTGPYYDPWWEDVDISSNNQSLYFKSRRSPSLKGKLEHFEANTFIVRWDDRTHEADAFIYFSMNAKSEISGFTMKAISPNTDFSYDFHHVNFRKK